jgi:protein-tyrosine phosphatase
VPGAHRARSAASRSIHRATSARGRTPISTDPASGPPHHGGGPHALRIDWIAAADLGDGLPGAIGLTILPGKHGVSARYPGVVFERDLARDLQDLRAADVRRLILLVDDAELARWGDPRIVELSLAAGIDVTRVPVTDGDAPSVAEMDRIVGVLSERRRAANVAVACLGGVGRTGTVAACALVRAGVAADAAIALVRRIRHPEAVETPQQEAFVTAYAARQGRRVP